MAYFNQLQSTVFLSFSVISLLQSANLLAGNSGSTGNGSAASSSGSSSSTPFPNAPAITPPTGLVAQRQPTQEEELEWEVGETLTTLERGIRPTTAQFEFLFRRLPAETARLSLYDTGLASTDLVYLKAWFRAGNGFQTIAVNLGTNAIGPEGARAIEALIKDRFWTQLERLALYEDELGEGGAAAGLFQAMTQVTLPRLTLLNLMSNGLTEASFSELANVLRDNRLPALERLILSANPLGDGEAAQAILEGAANVPTLTQLALINTGLGNQAATGLTRILAAGQFRNLQELHIHGNQFDVAHAKALADAWANGHDPEKLHLVAEGE